MANATFTGPVRSKNGFQLGVGFSPGVDGVYQPDVQVVDKILTTAQILALNATPITVLPAVGAALYLQFLGGVALLDYNSAAYASDAGEDFVLTNLAAGVVLSNSIDGTAFHATTDVAFELKPVAPVAASTTADVLVLNGGIEAAILSGEWITGNSPIKLRIFYRTVSKTDLEAIA